MQSRETIDADWRQLADQREGLHYLVAEGVEIDGVRFWGAPWYTDLWGAYEHEAVWEVEEVRQSVNDFQFPYDSCGEWSVRAHVEAHAAQTELLRAQAQKVDMVITHWPPTLRAMHPKFQGDALNPYFYNDADELVCHIGAQLWIGGHTHESWDCQVGITRCIYSLLDGDGELFGHVYERWGRVLCWAPYTWGEDIYYSTERLEDGGFGGDANRQWHLERIAHALTAWVDQQRGAGVDLARLRDTQLAVLILVAFRSERQ